MLKVTDISKAHDSSANTVIICLLRLRKEQNPLKSRCSSTDLQNITPH